MQTLSSLAAADLGLGDELLKQMKEQDEERRKKSGEMKEQLGPATALLFGL